MNAKVFRIALEVAILAAVAGASPQPPKNNDGPPSKQTRKQQLEEKAKELVEAKAKKLTQQYEQGKKQFLAAQVQAKAVLVGRFEIALKQIRVATGLPAELRREKLKKISAEKDAFVAKGSLPHSDEMLWSLLEYEETLFNARALAVTSYEQLFNLYSVLLQDDSRADELTADKEKFDQKSRGRTVFRRANWHGSQRGKNNISFVLNVGTLEGNNIKGNIVQDRRPNETVFKVEGLLKGNRVELNSTQVVQGKTRGLIFIGYVMENRILGQVFSVNPTNGKKSAPSLVLMYKAIK